MGWNLGWLRGVLALSMLSCGGSEGGPRMLLVDVRTDLIAEVEFDRIVTRVGDEARIVDASAGDWAMGVRAGTWSVEGAALIEIVAERRGSPVLSREARPSSRRATSA